MHRYATGSTCGGIARVILLHGAVGDALMIRPKDASDVRDHLFGERINALRAAYSPESMKGMGTNELEQLRHQLRLVQGAVPVTAVPRTGS